MRAVCNKTFRGGLRLELVWGMRERLQGTGSWGLRAPSGWQNHWIIPSGHGWRNPGIISAGKASVPMERSLSLHPERAGSAVPSRPARHFLPGRAWGGAAPPQSRGHGGLRAGAGEAARSGLEAGAAGGRRRGLCGVGRCAGARQVPGDRGLPPRPPPRPGAGRRHRRRRHHGSHAGVSGSPCPALSHPSDPCDCFKPWFLCCAESPQPLGLFPNALRVLQGERDGHRPGGAAGAVDG